MALLGSALILPAVASAQLTCHADIGISISPADDLTPGDVLTVVLTIGTGKIEGGTKITVNRVRYELDCADNSALGIPCPDAGDIFTYLGDSTIVSDCPGTWASNAPLGGNAPNEIVFTPSFPFDLPSNTPGYCSVRFGVGVGKVEPTIVPPGNAALAQVVAGFSAIDADAACDNGLVSPAAEVVGIQWRAAQRLENRRVRNLQRSGTEVPRTVGRRWAAVRPSWLAPHGQ